MILYDEWAGMWKEPAVTYFQNIFSFMNWHQIPEQHFNQVPPEWKSDAVSLSVNWSATQIIRVSCLYFYITAYELGITMKNFTDVFLLFINLQVTADDVFMRYFRKIGTLD